MANLVRQTWSPDGASSPVTHTLLGQQGFTLKTAGKIRPGIKVLSAAAERNEQARALYEEGMRRGDSFEQIEQRIITAVPELKQPLAMRNTPFFTVRRADMINPAIADQIMTLYGEDRGDGVRRLYRFPVLFPFDQWHMIVPHSLQSYSAGGLKYWSEFSPDGRRVCMTYAAPPAAGNASVVRIFGGRRRVPRADNGGLCEPELCAEYQSRRCNMTGRIIFWIPGVQTLLPLELPTSSYYSLSGVISLLQRVAYSRGGRLTGFLGRDKSTFWLSKSLQSVPRYDPQTNRVTRVEQWIIRLDAPIDVASLLDIVGDEDAVAAGQRAARALAHDATAEQPPCDAAPERADAPVGAVLAVDEEPAAAARQKAAAAAVRRKGDDASAEASPSLQRLHERLRELGVEQAQFDRYAAKKLGPGWHKNPRGVAKAIALAEAFDDPSAAPVPAPARSAEEDTL